MNELALCAGVGGMSLGLKLAVGDSALTVCYVEGEAYCAKVLAARMADGALDDAPIWSDIRSFDGAAWRGCVDIVSAGLPCQPYSVAGKQRGNDDDRALWPHFVRIVRECEPAIVFIENVPAFQKHFEPVWTELRAMGFEWAPALLQTASESGAPHIRRRFFALGTHADRVAVRQQSWRVGWEDWAGSAEPRRDCAINPNADGAGLEGWGLPRCGHTDERDPGSLGAADHPNADGVRLQSEWCGWLFDGERETLRHDADGCGDGCRIRGSFWDSESQILRMAARTPDWVDELRAIGNVGTPTVVYASAFRCLARELGLIPPGVTP